MGCRSKQGLRVERIGTYAIEPFAVVAGDVLASDSSQVLRLAPDGTVKWRSSTKGAWAIPRGSTGSAFVVAQSDNVDKAQLLEVELATGVSRPRSTVRPRIYDKWYRVGDALFVVYAGMIERIDPDTGQELWTKSADGAPIGMSANDEFWIKGPFRLRGYSLVDESKREITSGTWASMTPDGATLVTDFGADVIAVDTRSLERTWAHSGESNMAIIAIAASDHWIAVASQEKKQKARITVTVYRRSDGKQVWSDRSDKDEFFGYIAAGGDLVAYYDSSDAALHAVHMPDGKSAVVHQFAGGLSVSTERVGMAPAVPDGPPKIDGEIIIVNDDPVKRAYRVTVRN